MLILRDSFTPTVATTELPQGLRRSMRFHLDIVSWKYALSLEGLQRKFLFNDSDRRLFWCCFTGGGTLFVRAAVRGIEPVLP